MPDDLDHESLNEITGLSGGDAFRDKDNWRSRSECSNHGTAVTYGCSEGGCYEHDAKQLRWGLVTLEIIGPPHSAFNALIREGGGGLEEK